MPQPFADQFKSIAMSPDLSEALERAHSFAREQGHRAVTLEHLLLAFTEDVDASAVLQASNVDLIRLGTDVSAYLGRLLEDMRSPDGTPPGPDADLMRVLHAAVQAAQQSRRRQIDGAIVLAAVVGDGKSPAAGLLEAHGITFEEVIKALQKANAKANAQARSKQYATPAPAPAPVPPPPAPASAAPPPATNGAQPPPSPQRVTLEAADSGNTQSVDEILAAARSRIQQRTAAIVGKTPAPAAEAKPPVAEPEPPRMPAPQDAKPAGLPPVPEPDDEANDGEPEAARSAAPPPPPPAPPASRPPASRLPPPPQAAAPPGPPSPRLPQAPQQRPAAPFAPRAGQQGDGFQRPPQPFSAVPGGAPLPQPGLPNGTLRAPWPEGSAPSLQAQRPPMTNGALAEPPPAARRPAGPRTGGQSGQGPLVETIPRRMKLGAPTTAQVRLSRNRIEGLIQLLMKGRGIAHRPDALIARTLSVRLRAPDGGFWIEADSPETQWVETTAGGLQQDDHVTWRWTVTPRKRGRGRLVLVVAARTVGHDGLPAEMAAPDRTIDVAVSGGRMRGLGRWVGLLAALALGAFLNRFGGEFWAIGSTLIKRAIGG